MHLENVFFIMNFVDSKINEAENNKITSKLVEEFTLKLKSLSNSDFIEVLITCFIPDIYVDNGKKEKLYTKLVEVLVGEWWRRMGGTYNLPTKKSGREDVEIIYESKSIVCDAKTFRLGRSQKAPNVKDFLKLASVKTWMVNLEKTYIANNKEQNIIGGLVTYSSLHEWNGESEVYEECSNKDIPVLMLPYELLAILLTKRDRYNIEDLFKLWKYERIFSCSTRSKIEYWIKIKKLIIEITKLDEVEYIKLLNEYQKIILLSVEQYKSLILKNIENNRQIIEDEMNSFASHEEMKKYAIDRISNMVNQDNRVYLERIEKYRNY